MSRLILLTGTAISTLTTAGVVLYMQGLRNKLNKAEDITRSNKTYTTRSNKILTESMTDEQVREYIIRMARTYAVDIAFKE